MSAVFEWSESNGASEVITDDIANVNFGSVDSVEITPNSNTILTGANSYSKYIRGKFTGTFTEIYNIKFRKSSGDYKTGESITARANTTYSAPSTATMPDSTVPITEGAALSINSAEGASSIQYGVSGVSGYTAYIRLQTRSTSLTPAGSGNQKTFTLSYDEI
jgi:hypothetical protein